MASARSTSSTPSKKLETFRRSVRSSLGLAGPTWASSRDAPRDNLLRIREFSQLEEATERKCSHRKHVKHNSVAGGQQVKTTAFDQPAHKRKFRASARDDTYKGRCALVPIGAASFEDKSDSAAFPDRGSAAGVRSALCRVQPFPCLHRANLEQLAQP